MTRFLFDKKSIFQITVFAVFCGIFVTCLEVSRNEEATLETMFLLARDGYFKPATKHYSVDVLYSTINLLLFVPLVSKIFTEDFEVAKAYIFVRMNNVSKWYRHKFLQSFFYCFFSSMIYNVSLIFTTMALGYKAESVITVVWYVLFGTMSGFLILSMLVSANNILSLWIKPHLSAILVMIFTAIAIVVATFLNTEAVQYCFILNYFISWHLVVRSNELYYSYPTYLYYGIIAFVVALEYLMGRLLIKKKDFI